MTSDPESRWNVVLDELEAGLRRFEAELDGLEVATVEVGAVTHWQPPADMPSLPEALLERAASLSARMQTAEQRARSRQDALQGQLQELGLRRHAGAAYAAAGS